MVQEPGTKEPKESSAVRRTAPAGPRPSIARSACVVGHVVTTPPPPTTIRACMHAYRAWNANYMISALRRRSPPPGWDMHHTLWASLTVRSFFFRSSSRILVRRSTAALAAAVLSACCSTPHSRSHLGARMRATSSPCSRRPSCRSSHPEATSVGRTWRFPSRGWTDLVHVYVPRGGSCNHYRRGAAWFFFCAPTRYGTAWTRP